MKKAVIICALGIVLLEETLCHLKWKQIQFTVKSITNL